MCVCCFVQVAEGQEVCILEAMKMQNSLIAQKSAKVCYSQCQLFTLIPFLHTAVDIVLKYVTVNVNSLHYTIFTYSCRHSVKVCYSQ